MSGIAGFYQSQGQKNPKLIERMMEIMAHRGPDGLNHWQSETSTGVALGHCSLITTPEAQWETFPLYSGSCGLTLTCDARLDNRKYLLGQLRAELERLQVLAVPSPTENENIGDGALILAAYLRWGEGCAEHLLGDFAFALWDEKQQHLFCARDHVGVKPFYYHHAPGASFVFASEIKAILQAPEVSDAHNETRIAEYLLFAFGSHENTSYQDVARLPAAHTLTVSRTEFRLQRYWDLRDTPMQNGLSDAQCDARFREILFEAVRCRMRSRAGEVGGFLSGGIDSSAVMCVAREVEREKTSGESAELLPVFSTIYNEVRECDEREWIQHVLDGGGLEPNWIVGEERSALMDVERIQWHMDEPLVAPNLCSGWVQYQRAGAQGVRILLDGHGGDETVGYGHNRLHELALAGQWRILWRELRALEKHGFGENENVNALTLLRLYVIAYWRPFRLLRRASGGLRRRLNRGASRSQPQKTQSQPIEAQHDDSDLISAEFAERIGAAQIMAQWQPTQPHSHSSDREKNQRLLANALQPLALETLDKAAAAAGTEARYPLWDKRLVEFCLSLPADQKLRDGWSRLIIRRALDGVMPPEVQWRTSKNNFMAELRRGLRTYETARLHELAADETSALKNYVDKSNLRVFIEQTLGTASNEECQAHHVLRAACFRSWLLQDNRVLNEEREEMDTTERPAQEIACSRVQ